MALDDFTKPSKEIGSLFWDSMSRDFAALYAGDGIGDKENQVTGASDGSREELSEYAFRYGFVYGWFAARGYLPPVFKKDGRGLVLSDDLHQGDI